jgi:signal transduction histidine kinase
MARRSQPQRQHVYGGPTTRSVVVDKRQDLHIQRTILIDTWQTLQVLKNLLTNAIKFTASSTTREIVVSVGASLDRPTNFSEGVEYLVNPDTKDPTSPRADDEVYLTIAVKDTGRGITPDEMKGLFQRFQQASPKTHIKYGGSGLGLFISRELASRQGGQIGVASESGRGSTFAFYVMAQRCGQPKAHDPHHDAISKVDPRKRSKAYILTAAATAEEEMQSHVTHELVSRSTGSRNG